MTRLVHPRASPALILLAALGVGRSALGQAGLDTDDRVWVSYQREQRIQDLLDFCSLDYDLEVEYDPEQIQGNVTVRPGRRVATSEIWATAHRGLASMALTTVQMPGANSLRVVRIDEAASLARLESSDLAGARAGFLKVLMPVERAGTQELGVAIRLVLTEDGTITELRDSNALVVSDLAPNVRQALDLARSMDGSESTPAIEEIEVRNTSPVSLAAWLGQLEQASSQYPVRERSGKLLANADNGTILIIAPPDEMPAWRQLVQRFDRAERAYAAHYTPKRFGLAETADLIEQVVYAGGSRDPTGAWDLVTDRLTGTLVVRAPHSKHIEIEELLARLESTAYGVRRPIRAFLIRNRQVAEMLELLQGLLDAGALAAPEPGTPSSGESELAQGPTAPLVGERRPAVIERKGGVTLTADEATNRIVAMGEARLLDQLEVLIETLDVRHAQVLVEAIVVSIAETETLDLGVELRRAGASRGTLYELASLFGLSSVTPGSPAIPAATGTGFSGVLLDPRDFSAVVRALETLNDGRSLTIPKVLVNNNQDAILESVAQSPFASTNASDTVATTSFGGTLDAGTSITVKPQITQGDHLVLDYSISLSSFTGDSADPNLPPPRQESRLDSVVTIPDGHCVVVGGLEVETDNQATSEVPVLGSLPLLGHLFRNRSETTTNTRFFVFLRANVLRSKAFRDLKYASRASLDAAGVDGGLPSLKPRVIR